MLSRKVKLDTFNMTAFQGFSVKEASLVFVAPQTPPGVPGPLSPSQRLLMHLRVLAPQCVALGPRVLMGVFCRRGLDPVAAVVWECQCQAGGGLLGQGGSLQFCYVIYVCG